MLEVLDGDTEDLRVRNGEKAAQEEAGPMTANNAALCGIEKMETRVLNLTGSCLACSAMVIIADALKGNHVLQTLILRSNSIKERGACAIAEAINWSPALTDLDFSDNFIGDGGCLSFGKALRENSLLRSFQVENNGLTSVGFLGISTALAEGGGVGLEELNFASNHVDDAPVLKLADVVAYRRIRPPSAARSGRESKPPERLCRLRSLKLRDGHVGRAAARALVDAMLNAVEPCVLEELDLTRLPVGVGAGQILGRALAHCLQLQTLRLTGCGIGDAGAEAIANALRSKGVVLRCLDLQGNNVGPSSAAAFAHAFEGGCKLEHLNLADNAVGDDGAMALAQGLLCGDEMLKHLDLSSNKIGADGAAAMCTTLASNRTLTHLSFRFNPLGDAGAASFSDVLRHNDVVESLDFRGTGITAAGVVYISDALASNRSLRHLSLRGNDLGEFGCESLGEALRENSSLTSLDLMGSGVGEEGARHLAWSLEENRTLRRLDLMGNDVGLGGSMALARAVSHGLGGPLESLDLMNNTIHGQGVTAMVHAVEANSALTGLEYAQNKLQDEAAVRIDEAIRQNKSAISLERVV